MGAAREMDEDLREWALHRPELARQVREGYDVTSAVIGEVIKDALIALVDFGSTVLLVEDTPAFHEARWEDRKNPRLRALELRDQVEAIMRKIDRPFVMNIQVSRVVHYQAHRDAAYQTACLVDIETPGAGSRVLVVSCE